MVVMENKQKVRKARVTAEVFGAGLEVGAEVRVVSDLVPFPLFVAGVSPAEEYYLVTTLEDLKFLPNLLTTDDDEADAVWDYGTTVWAEPQALEFLPEED